MDDLVTRVLAAIEAKEAKARAAADNDGNLTWKVSPVLAAGPGNNTIRTAAARPVARISTRDSGTPGNPHATFHGDAIAAHIVDNDPEGVLRRCAADRRIVDMYLTELRVAQEDNPHRIGAARMWGGGKLSGARIAVVLVADGYGLVKADDVFSQMAYAGGDTEEPV